MIPLPDGVVVADSVTKPTPAWVGSVLIAGSHGGVYAAYLAAKAGVRGIILNDAGTGKDGAGIGGGAYCAGLSLPYATVDTMSARIGNGTDMARRGVISFVNPPAAAASVTVGMAAIEAARLLSVVPVVPAEAPAYEEARTELEPGPSGRRIVLVDSASLIKAGEAGQVVICGSHGGVPGPDPASALKVDAYAAFFNDAGGGADGAGYTRLPALDGRGIIAGTVAAMSARIGDARSTYEDGILSRVNEAAARAGGGAGMALRTFAAMLVR